MPFFEIDISLVIFKYEEATKLSYETRRTQEEIGKP